MALRFFRDIHILDPLYGAGTHMLQLLKIFSEFRFFLSEPGKGRSGGMPDVVDDKLVLRTVFLDACEWKCWEDPPRATAVEDTSL